jgi:hypothetical protein
MNAGRILCKLGWVRPYLVGLRFVALSCALISQAAVAAEAEAEGSVWDDLSSNLTLSSRLIRNQARQASVEADSTPEWRLESRALWQGQWRDWTMTSLLQHEPRHAEVDVHHQLTELAWNPLIEESLGLTLGKLSRGYEQPGPFQTLNFTQRAVSPFDDYADIEGFWLLTTDWTIREADTGPSGSLHWMRNPMSGWSISPLLAEVQSTGDVPDVDGAIVRPRYQWQLVLQKDSGSLSSNLLLQQYQGQSAGFGGAFSWVPALAWQFWGSGFVRQGTAYTDSLQSAYAAIQDFEAVQVDTSEFRRSSSRWYPRVVLGVEWSGLSKSFQLGWHYDARKLNRNEQRLLYLLNANAVGSIPASVSAETIELIVQSGLSLAHALRGIQSERYQRHYGFARYVWKDSENSWSFDLLVGEDQSQIRQLSYEHSLTWSLTLLAQAIQFSGSSDTEFGEAPFEHQCRVGVQWVL